MLHDLHLPVSSLKFYGCYKKYLLLVSIPEPEWFLHWHPLDLHIF